MQAETYSKRVSKWTSRIAGQDGPNRTALPTGEFFHPVSLVALLILIVNDWYLKPNYGSGAITGTLTGKLSDVAGLVFFPLLLTSIVDCILLAVSRLGLDVNFTLTPAKTKAALALTAIVFTAIKISPDVNHLIITTLESSGIVAKIVMDPTDLVALLALYIPWRISTWEIARVPLGRIALIANRHSQRKGQHHDLVEHALKDVLLLGNNPQDHRQLVDSMNEYLVRRTPESASSLQKALNTMRDLSEEPG